MDIYTWLVVGTFAGLIGLDAVAPARRFPAIRAWRLIGVAGFVIYSAVAMLLPLVWDSWLGKYRLIDATGLGPVTGAIVGVLALELGLYWWHRLLHHSSFMWRWFHQVHHSAERVDIGGAFYFSPLDMAGFTLASSLSLVLVVGVSAEAAIVASTIVTLLAIIGHANVRTPAWLGYLVQRPENHALHHQRGVHRYNYADLSIIDMLFGTFRNPRTWDEQAGFFDGSASRLGDMLRGHDIAAEHEAATHDPIDHPTPATLRRAA